MINVETQRKLDLAVTITRGIDEPFDTMMQTHGIVISPFIETVTLSDDGQLSVNPDYVRRIEIAYLIAVFRHEARHLSLRHLERWKKYREALYKADWPEDLIMSGVRRWTLVTLMWNIASDLELADFMQTMPVTRDKDGIKSFKPPCSQVACMESELVMDYWFKKETDRTEIHEFAKGRIP